MWFTRYSISCVYHCCQDFPMVCMNWYSNFPKTDVSLTGIVIVYMLTIQNSYSLNCTFVSWTNKFGSTDSDYWLSALPTGAGKRTSWTCFAKRNGKFVLTDTVRHLLRNPPNVAPPHHRKVKNKVQTSGGKPLRASHQTKTQGVRFCIPLVFWCG